MTRLEVHPRDSKAMQIPLGDPYGPVEIDRDRLQDLFCQGLEDAGIDVYGYPQTFEAAEGQMENLPAFAWSVGDFVVCPYIWDIPDGREVWHRTPNFYDAKTDTAIWWYKYALRSPTANRAVDAKAVIEMTERLKAETRRLGSRAYE